MLFFFCWVERHFLKANMAMEEQNSIKSNITGLAKLNAVGPPKPNFEAFFFFFYSLRFFTGDLLTSTYQPLVYIANCTPQKKCSKPNMTFTLINQTRHGPDEGLVPNHHHVIYIFLLLSTLNSQLHYYKFDHASHTLPTHIYGPFFVQLFLLTIKMDFMLHT